MVHEIFDTNAHGYDDYIQIGSGVTEEFPFFKGGSVYQRGYGYQRGAGIGDIFHGIWRFFLPILRRAGQSISKEALNTGQRIIDDVKEGKPLKEALITEGKKAVDNVLEQGGLPKQFGGGGFVQRRRKKRKTIKSQPPFSTQTIIGNAITKPVAHSKKRLRSDVFGLY